MFGGRGDRPRGAKVSAAMEIAIISDTHMPRPGRALPDACVRRLRAADLILHAGDLVRLSVLRELQALGTVVAVHGNVDGADVRAALPAVQIVRVGGPDGLTIAMTHDAGPSTGRLARMRRRFPDADAVVFGHSHVPLHEGSPDGFQLFNPGSPTERRRAPRHTMGIATADDGRVTFELIELD
jgi:putative phosphoesterase